MLADLVVAVMVGATLGGTTVAWLALWERRGKLHRKRFWRCLHRFRDHRRRDAAIAEVTGNKPAVRPWELDYE